jgi:hypothetical protein
VIAPAALTVQLISLRFPEPSRQAVTTRLPRAMSMFVAAPA